MKSYEILYEIPTVGLLFLEKLHEILVGQATNQWE